MRLSKLIFCFTDQLLHKKYRCQQKIVLYFYCEHNLLWYTDK